MSKYEEVKEKMRQEEEDKKKIHVKYTEEEYEELMSILEGKKEKENNLVETQNPVESKKVNKNAIPQINYDNHLARYYNNRSRNRFGK